MLKDHAPLPVHKSPEATHMYDHVAMFTKKMLEASGRAIEIMPSQMENVIGYYLLWKGALQQKAAREAMERGELEWSIRLETSAMKYAVLSLQTSPSVVTGANVPITVENLQYPFHRARLFGQQLAEEELRVRGERGYKADLTPKEERKLAHMLRLQNIKAKRYRNPAA